MESEFAGRVRAVKLGAVRGKRRGVQRYAPAAIGIKQATQVRSSSARPGDRTTAHRAEHAGTGHKYALRSPSAELGKNTAFRLISCAEARCRLHSSSLQLIAASFRAFVARRRTRQSHSRGGARANVMRFAACPSSPALWRRALSGQRAAAGDRRSSTRDAHHRRRWRLRRVQ